MIVEPGTLWVLECRSTRQDHIHPGIRNIRNIQTQTYICMILLVSNRHQHRQKDIHIRHTHKQTQTGAGMKTDTQTNTDTDTDTWTQTHGHRHMDTAHRHTPCYALPALLPPCKCLLRSLLRQSETFCSWEFEVWNFNIWKWQSCQKKVTWGSSELMGRWATLLRSMGKIPKRR